MRRVIHSLALSLALSLIPISVDAAEDLESKSRALLKKAEALFDQGNRAAEMADYAEVDEDGDLAKKALKEVAIVKSAAKEIISQAKALRALAISSSNLDVELLLDDAIDSAEAAIDAANIAEETANSVLETIEENNPSTPSPTPSLSPTPSPKEPISPQPSPISSASDKTLPTSSPIISASAKPTTSLTPAVAPSKSSKVSTPSSAPVKKVITITCVKGKSVKKISGASPKCPAGYKKK